MENSVFIEISGNKYEIRYPNVGEYYRIECLKQNLSNGSYGNLLLSNSLNAMNALDMIDIEATLLVLAPNLIRDLKVKNLSELGIKDYVMIREAYIKNVVPFFKEINELLKLK